MDITFSLNNWRIQKDEKTGISKLTGKYDLIMNGKIIASQGFNDGYSSTEIPFSGDLMHKLVDLETQVLNEIKKMIT